MVLFSVEPKLKLISLTRVLILQGRCGGDGQWFRRLKGTAGLVRLRWSSGNRVLCDPATDGSTARGPSAVLRSLVSSFYIAFIDQMAECKFTDQSSSNLNLSTTRRNFFTESQVHSKKSFCSSLVNSDF